MATLLKVPNMASQFVFGMITVRRNGVEQKEKHVHMGAMYYFMYTMFQLPLLSFHREITKK
jgi:hypothetical protein